MKNYIPLLSIALMSLLIQCSTDSEMSLTSLVKVSIESAGNNCATGGSRIDSGIDINNSKSLELNEIQNTVYICNGVNGSSSLINTTIEPNGSNCSSGGYKIDIGIDTNADGNLASSEVTTTTFLCNFTSQSSSKTLVGRWQFDNGIVSGEFNVADYNGQWAIVNENGFFKYNGETYPITKNSGLNPKTCCAWSFDNFYLNDYFSSTALYLDEVTINSSYDRLTSSAFGLRIDGVSVISNNSTITSFVKM
jgi:hypothetical protein